MGPGSGSYGSLDHVAKTSPKQSVRLVPVAALQKQIVVVRDRQVMLDQDLAELYGVETGALTRAVRRNIERFPHDFMFQLSKDEFDALKRQFDSSSEGGHGGRRFEPYVFTEQGVAMLSSVLRSERAVAVNIEIIRAFVELRRVAASHAVLEEKIEELERETTARLDKHDQQLDQIFKSLRQLIAPPPKPKRKIGFAPPEEN